ncbi:hypothetical protein ABIF27_005433 [Bradyrhizobium elkanii]
MCFAPLQGKFGPPSLRDIFAGDKDNGLLIRPEHSFGAFTYPQDRAVLPDLLDVPSARLSDVLQARPNARAILLEKYLQHGLTDQFSTSIAELCRAECIDVEDSAGFIDHEVHGWIVLEDGAPPLFAILQIGRTPLKLGRNHTRSLSFLTERTDQVRSHNRGNKECNNHGQISGGIDSQAERRRRKVISESSNGYDAKRGRRDEAAHQRKQQDH